MSSSAGSGLTQLHIDNSPDWQLTGVSIDGVVRAVTPVSDDHSDSVARVWVPAGEHRVCVGGVPAGTKPSFWDAGTELTPAPGQANEPDAEISADEAPPEATPTPTPVPTPTPLPTPTPQPFELRSPHCADAQGSVALPGHLFPGHRVVAHYGTGITPFLGVLGEGTPQQATDRLVEAAEAFADFDLPVVPAFEFIATVAQAGPGSDGSFSFARPVEEVQTYLDQVRSVGGIMVIDLQPGRATFLDQLLLYEDLLREPDVHLALDPEWSMEPGQVPGQVIGHTDASVVNEVLHHLQALVVEHGLPQKLLIVHQFRAGMVRDRDSIVDPEGIAVMFHIDGQGPVASKYDTYAAISASPPFFSGFKVFFDEDPRVLSPEEIMELDPVPLYISYQ